MALFVSPGSIITLVCAGVPFFLIWIYVRIINVFTHFAPEIEYFALKLCWFLTKSYMFCDRHVCKITGSFNNVLGNTSNRNVRLIKDGNIVQKIPLDRLNEVDKDCDYDMVLLEYSIEEPNLAKQKNHIIRTSLVEEVTDYFEVSGVSFIGININIKEDDNIVKTESVFFGSENYYVVGNVLFDRIFIRYWLNRSSSFEMTDNQHYEISFFDNDISPHNIKEPEYVQITDNGFNIISPNVSCKESNEKINEPCPDINDGDCDCDCDVTSELEVEPENIMNIMNSDKELFDKEPFDKNCLLPGGNYLYSYFGGKTNWNKSIETKNL